MISCGIAKATKLNEQKSNDYDQGRLEMIDIQSSNASLKMKWVQIYLNTEDKDKWKVFFFRLLPGTWRDTAGYYCSSAHNLKQKDASQLKIKDPFLKEIEEYWFNLNFSEKNPVFDSTCNWHNSLITIA